MFDVPQLLSQFMEYARVDGDDEDSTLVMLLIAADSAVRETTGKVRPECGSTEYDIAVMMLASHWYDNRTPTSDTHAEHREIPYTMQWLLNYISMCSLFPDSEENDGTDK